jgi:hypothetical protein
LQGNEPAVSNTDSRIKRRELRAKETNGKGSYIQAAIDKKNNSAVSVITGMD